MSNLRGHWPFPSSRFDTGTHSLAGEHNAELEDYIKLLKAHDWTFEFSDDQTVWRQGRQERATLEALQRQLDPAKIIWDQHAKD